jgi:hypothetical protein
MRTIYKVAAGLFIALGVVHISVTPLIFTQFSAGTLWFVSGGLMGIFLGFLNLAIIRTDGKDVIIKYLGIIANLLATIFFSVGIILVERSPQGFIGLFLIISLTTLSIKFGGTSSAFDDTA